MTDGLARGVFAAALTPLNARLAPDIDAFLAHCRWLLDHGCDGLGILGSTGEANSLPLALRCEMIRAAADGLPHERLLVGTGACALADAITLTRASVEAGVNTVLVLPPFYYKPVADGGVFRYFAGLIDGVANDNLRIYLYNFPQLTGFSFETPLVERLKSRFGPVIAGMKDSSGELAHMKALAAVPGFSVYAGTERYLLAMLEEAGTGCISATANVTSAICAQVVAAWRNGGADGLANAQPIQERLTAIRLALQTLPVVPELKALMGAHGDTARWAGVLPPFEPLATGDLATLRGALGELGFAGPGAKLTAPAPAV